jgi:hypothetical protein
VLVELKAIVVLEDVHLAQILNYLKAYRLKVGLLINFRSKSLAFNTKENDLWDPLIRIISDPDRKAVNHGKIKICRHH